MTGRRIHTRSTKYDGTFHWEYTSSLVLDEAPLVVTEDCAGDLMQNKGGPWTCPYHVRNHYWSDRWYNVMRFEMPDRQFEGWYCNVSTPAQFDGEHLTWTDLDLDVRVWPDGRVEVLDEDEFIENAERMAYPTDVIESARRAVDELLGMIDRAEFPFGQP